MEEKKEHYKKIKEENKKQKEIIQTKEKDNQNMKEAMREKKG